MCLIHDNLDMSDLEVAERAQLGDREWLAELFRRYERRMYGCAHRMVAVGEVEDTVQEIALRIMGGLPRFRGDSSISTWIYSVARHTCLDVRRRRKETFDLDNMPELADDTTSPEDSFEMTIMACRAASAMGKLPESQQDVVLLRLGEGLSTEETAAELDITVDAVKARLRRARATLRAELGESVSCPVCGPGAYSLDSSGVVSPSSAAMTGGD